MSLELLQDTVEFDSVKLKIVVRFKIKKLKKKILIIVQKNRKL